MEENFISPEARFSQNQELNFSRLLLQIVNVRLFSIHFVNHSTSVVKGVENYRKLKLIH